MNSILAAAKAQAAQDQQQIAKESWWDKVYTYGKGFATNVADGAVNATEAGGQMIASLFEDAGDILALSARIQYDETTGNSADLQQISAQAQAKAQSIVSGIESAYDTMQAVYEDADTRAILENFAEDYYHSMSGLMMLKDVGSFTGGIIPGIVIAIITKNPEALGAGIAKSAGSDIAAAGNEVEAIAGTLVKKEKCAEMPGADVDKTHEVTKPKTINDYKALIENLDVSTDKNTAVFYSGPGNRELAESFAQQNGKTTLEQTSGGEYLDKELLFDQFPKDQAVEVWRRISQRYAEQASGEVYVFSKGANPSSVFMEYELPALQANPNVTKIIYMN